MELCSSYVGLSFILLCILLMCVCKLISVVSNMIKMSSTYLMYCVLGVQKLFYVCVFILL
jgi:hypothetical protein